MWPIPDSRQVYLSLIICLKNLWKCVFEQKRPTYKLALQVPTAAVTQVSNHQSTDEINEQDTCHREDHINDGEL